MSAAQRRAAEANMARRDRLERGGRRGARAAARSRMPDFLQSDDMEDDDVDGGLLAGMKRRTRRQYDERKDLDDLEGVEDVSIAIVWYGQAVLTLYAGASAGATERYQSKVHCGMDRQRACSAIYRSAFPPVPHDLR